MFTTGLAPAETERLALLMEECAEVQHVIGKILRHGYQSYNPNDEHRTPNRQLLEKELGDLRAAMQLMIREDDISLAAIGRAYTDKTMRLAQYLHHQSAR